MIVLDSSFLVAYHNTRDVHHVAAVAAMDKLIEGAWGRALLLEYVFVEVVTVLLVRRDLPTAMRVAETLLQAREVELVLCSDLFLPTLDVFRRQPLESLSFTDCAIALVARRHSPGFVATFDRDFAGLEGISAIPA